MSELPIPYYTEDEYLELDRASDIKYEYIDGFIHAMSGGSASHSAIAANITGELTSRLRGRCRVYQSDLKVATGSRLYAYPDVSVVCETPRFRDQSEDTLLNPLLIVEVLSPSTESRDRGRKSILYRQIESLIDYVLVSQHIPFVELYHRNPDGEWVYRSAYGVDESIRLPSVGLVLRLADIYDLVSFPPTETEKPNDDRDDRLI